VGNEATVTVDAIPDEPFVGRVSRIAPVLDAATRSALIEIDIPNRNGMLKAEMFARIHLDLGTMRDAVLIPRDGLVYRGQQPGVFVIEGDTPIFRAIETGMTREDEVEVLANLAPGTKIVGRGATMIREGDRVRLSGGPGQAARDHGSQAGTPGTTRAAENRPPSESGAGAAPGSAR
jgi:multidrug efflux pump subunit AcrA (membrane-fusion protein)